MKAQPTVVDGRASYAKKDTGVCLVLDCDGATVLYRALRSYNPETSGNEIQDARRAVLKALERA